MNALGHQAVEKFLVCPQVRRAKLVEIVQTSALVGLRVVCRWMPKMLSSSRGDSYSPNVLDSDREPYCEVGPLWSLQ